MKTTDISDSIVIGHDIIPFPIITSSKICPTCKYKMKDHGYINAIDTAICPCDHCGSYNCHWLMHG